MWNYPQEFASLCRKLRIENSIFRGTIEILLRDCVDNDTLAGLLDGKAGDAWSNPAVAKAVSRRMARSFDDFVATVRSMDQSLDEFKVRLKLGPDGKCPFDDTRSFKEAYKRFRFALKKSAYMDLIDEIRKDNDALKKLTKQAHTLEAVTKTRRPQTASFDRVRGQAVSLYDTLQRGLRRSCAVSHRASLCLRATDEGDDLAVVEETLRFRVLIQHEMPKKPGGLTVTTSIPPWLVEEAEIRVLPMAPAVVIGLSSLSSSLPVRAPTVRFQQAPAPTAPNPMVAQVTSGNPTSGAVAAVSMPQVHDLCQSLTISRSLKCGTCIGYMQGQHMLRHGLYLPDQPLVGRDGSSALTVAQVLGNSLTVADSRLLALAVARGMLQLHGTPWLTRQWGRKQILLFRRGEKLLASSPFVSAALPEGQPLSPTDDQEYFPENSSIRNPTVFSLGIMLIELGLRKPFDEMLDTSDLNPDGSKHPASDFFAANRLLDRVYEQQSTRYGDAVRRCIRCEFDQRKTSLDDKEFAQAVYNGVVAVLEEDNRWFFGG